MEKPVVTSPYGSQVSMEDDVEQVSYLSVTSVI